MQNWSIDPDIARAETPPGELYCSDEVFAACRDRVFAPSWQFIGDETVTRLPGQAHPFTMLEGMLDEPLVLVRGKDDIVRCMSNVCTHRAALVVEHPGMIAGQSMRCRYHGRRFAMDGKFVSIPDFDGVENFPSACDDLRRVETGKWGPFLFASIEPQVVLDDVIADMRKRLAWFPANECKFDATRSRDYLVRCNWALYCENYLEGFHIPFVHPSLAESLDVANYAVELFEHSILQIGIAKGDESCFALPPNSPDHGRRIAAYYYWFWPNTMFNIYPWGISVNVVRPVKPDLTRVSFLSYVLDESKIEEGAGAAIDRVEREDEAVVESVQRGLRGRLYKRGRYSPRQELGTHHFHRMIDRALRRT